MTTPSAAIFDNDGLLLDTEEAWTRAEQHAVRRARARVHDEHKRTLIGSSRTLAATKLEAILELPGDGEALMDELHELVMQEALQGVEPRPGALDLLARLAAAGIAPSRRVELRARSSSSARSPSAGLLRRRPVRRRSSRPTTSSTPSPRPTSTWRRARGSASRPSRRRRAGGLADRRRRRRSSRHVRDRRALLRRHGHPRREPARRQPRRRGRRAARSASARSRGEPARRSRRQRADGRQQRAGARDRGRQLGVRRTRSAARGAARARAARSASAARRSARASRPARARAARASATVASISTLPPPSSAGPRRTRYSSPVSLTHAARCSGSWASSRHHSPTSRSRECTRRASAR